MSTIILKSPYVVEQADAYSLRHKGKVKTTTTRLQLGSSLFGRIEVIPFDPKKEDHKKWVKTLIPSSEGQKPYLISVESLSKRLSFLGKEIQESDIRTLAEEGNLGFFLQGTHQQLLQEEKDFRDLTQQEIEAGGLAFTKIDPNGEETSKYEGPVSYEEIKQIQDYVKRKKTPPGTYIPRFQSHLSRPIFISPEGHVLIIDLRLGKGGVKEARFALDIDEKAGTQNALLVCSRSSEISLFAQEKLLQMVPQTERFLHPAFPQKALFEYKGKKNPHKQRLFTKFCNGGTFQKIMKKLPNSEKIRIFQELVEPLVYLHQKNLVHRDLKPENIFFERDQTGTIHPLLADLDFLCSAYTLQTSSDPELRRPLGTLPYLSPEYLSAILYAKKHSTEDFSKLFSESSQETQESPKILFDPTLRIATATTTAHDAWAFGCILYEMFLGELPWKKLHAGEKFSEKSLSEKISTFQFPQINPEHPLFPITQIIQGLLQKDPFQRISVLEAQSKLSDYLIPNPSASSE